MQPKTFLTAIICLLFAITATAQTGRQPFSDIGKKVKVLTLTDGRYEEFFDDDSIQQIGSAWINVNTMQLVKLKLTKEEQRLFDNSSSSRFLSTDPLTSSYPMLTPYQYASNRPIDGIDLDGKEWATETKIGKTNTAIEIQTSFTVRVKVENQSKIVTDPNIVKAKAEVYKNSLEGKYKGEATFILYGVPFKVIYKTEVVLDYAPPNANDGAIGHLIFDDRTSSSSTTVTTSGNVTTTNTLTSSTPGDTRGEINNFTTRIGITMDGIIVNDADIASTDEHEGGHSAGLNHPWELQDIEKNLLPKLNQSNPKTADVTTIKNNAMNSSENPDATYRSNGGGDLLLGQLFVMWKRISSNSYYTTEELKAAAGPNSGSSPNNTPSSTDNKNKNPK